MFQARLPRGCLPPSQIAVFPAPGVTPHSGRGASTRAPRGPSQGHMGLGPRRSVDGDHAQPSPQIATHIRAKSGLPPRLCGRGGGVGPPHALPSSGCTNTRERKPPPGLAPSVTVRASRPPGHQCCGGSGAAGEGNRSFLCARAPSRAGSPADVSRAMCSAPAWRREGGAGEPPGREGGAGRGRGRGGGGRAEEAARRRPPGPIPGCTVAPSAARSDWTSSCHPRWGCSASGSQSTPSDGPSWREGRAPVSGAWGGAGMGGEAGPGGAGAEGRRGPGHTR